MVPVSVALPATGTRTGSGRPQKAKSAEAVLANTVRPFSSSVAGSTGAPSTVR
jgi:hypothetical protein